MSEAQDGAIGFTMRKFQLVPLVDWAASVVPASSQLLVNRCLRVTVGPDRLELAGAGGQLNVFAEATAVVTQSAGTLFLPAKVLRTLLAEAPDGDVTVLARAGLAEVTAGSASWSLRLPRPESYAGLPDLSGAGFVPVDRAQLLAALQAVRHAVGTDAGRPAYTQVGIMESGGAMFACATDSAQFARVPLPGFPSPLQVPGAVLGDLVKLLAKSADETVLAADHGPCTVFRAGPVTLAAAKLAAGLPDVSGLVAAGHANDLTLTADKAELAAALRRVRVSASARTSAVALIIDADGPHPGITVTTRDEAGNSAEAPVAAKWDGGRELVVVNGGFLAAMIAAYPAQTCTFKVGKARGAQLAPLVLEDEESGTLSTCQQLVHRVLGY